ncbi:hypothetical protein [Liquorilactobacillus mali]|uniref:Uncharacterized protein n=1 Tax=Liquorilactobacillus mali KCTC 3596 = DSM 20444 TaxID=1046596 RepID=A0A0R2E3C5_9LACO|nr:hypothetical protein [Liquorilactobacillus mali]KRN10808.1 hypothetical protein FD00_GL002050 [Liquorilactobacillus mali KCTC 3596 = DSM 20444]
MKKTSLVATVAVALGVFGGQQFIISKQAGDINSANQSVATMKQKNYEFATGKRALKLENGQTIKTDKFEIQYVANGKKWSAVIVPTDKNSRLLGQQGEGAKGLELDSVSYLDTGLTTIVDK